jgi:HK97 family phage portal protein
VSRFLEVFNRRPVREEPPAEQRAIVDLPWIAGGLSPTEARTITVDTATRLAPVFSAWRILGSSVASLPLHAYRDLGDRRQRMGSAPQLFQAPSVQGTLYDWLHRLVISLLSRGNAIGMVTSRDGFGFPTGIEWLNPDDVHCDDRSFARPDWYYQGRLVPREQIVHIPWFPVAGKVLGLSPLGAAAATVNRGLSAQSYSQDWFNAGGVPPGTYKNVNKTIDEPTAQAAKARLVRAIRTREPIVYGADWEFTAISVPPREAQFVEGMKLDATQIASIYGVPPEEIGGEAGGSLTYNTVEQNDIKLTQRGVRPLVVKLEQAFFQWLPERQYVRFNLDAMIRTDTKTRYEVHEIARRIGLESIDEQRELEDREPLPDGQGATHTPQPLLEKGIGSVPKPGDKPEPPAPRPAPEPEQERPPRLRPVAGEG